MAQSVPQVHFLPESHAVGAALCRLTTCQGNRPPGCFHPRPRLCFVVRLYLLEKVLRVPIPQRGATEACCDTPVRYREYCRVLVVILLYTVTRFWVIIQSRGPGEHCGQGAPLPGFCRGFRDTPSTESRRPLSSQGERKSPFAASPRSLLSFPRATKVAGTETTTGTRAVPDCE